jgi:hypothetical protein
MERERVDRLAEGWDGLHVTVEPPSTDAIRAVVTMLETLPEPQAAAAITGVDERPRIAALADGDQILASRSTAADARFPVSEPRTVTLRGTTEPVEIVSVDWG